MKPKQPSTAPDVLTGLCEGFFDDLAWLRQCAVIEPQRMPDEARHLLDHHEHMTGRLKAHHGGPVALRVLAHRAEGDMYRRKILLTADGGRRVVEFGIVRMSLRPVDEAARREILARRTPLGEVFARYEVLTKVEPRWFLRFPSGTPFVQYFAGASEAFGRIGRIHCNGEPAVELLEVVPQ